MEYLVIEVTAGFLAEVLIDEILHEAIVEVDWIQI